MKAVLTIAGVLAASAPAAAEKMGFLRLAAGGSVPFADDTWSSGQEPGLKIGAQAGIVERFGVMGSLDYTFPRVASASGLYPSNAEHETLRRLRVLAHGLYATRIDDNITALVRAGIGFERFYAGHDVLMAGTYYPASRSHDGLAFELGCAFWFDLPVGSADVDAGLDVGFPIAKHTEKPVLGVYAGDSFTSFDLDLLVAIRITSLD